MSDVTVTIELAASPWAVWTAIEPIERHVDWMADAASIDFVGAQTRGVGTRFRCLTKIGPIKLTDEMVITEWVPIDPERPDVRGRLGVRHDGVVGGTGVFTIEALPNDATRTRFSWSEDLTFPWYLGGRLGAIVGGRVVLGPLWRRNLRTLQRLVEHPG